MPLAPGTRLGPHEILGPLGAGGMGEVYRARDTRLDRTVALKVLPGHLSGNEELRQRFDREAKAISALSHPHICALYDVGHQDGVDYLVMEFLEGDTLSDRLARGPLPPEQVLRYGTQIADALDKAHRQGIVHRDLKPGNVMITKSGVKLLDFGLARALVPASAATQLTAVPTQAAALTQEGTILGTLQYMAPEQLEAKEADTRTDIFAFGAVLYEMATGKKPFVGKSQASLIAANRVATPHEDALRLPASRVRGRAGRLRLALGTTGLAAQLAGQYQSVGKWNGEVDEGTGFHNGGVFLRGSFLVAKGWRVTPGIYREVYSESLSDESFRQGTTYSIAITRFLD